MKIVGLILALLLLGSPTTTFAQCYQVNFATYGAKLDEELTEAQVVTIIGYTPQAVSLDTCGQESKGGAWQCKTYTYGALCSGELIIYFRKNSSGIWVVNNWTATAPLRF